MQKHRSTILAGLGGLAATVVDVALLVLLVELAVPVGIAAGLGVLAGAVAGFLVNNYVAFRDHSPISVKQVGAFGLVAVGTALLMALGMQLTVVGLGLPVLLGKLVCAVVMFFAWSLPAQKRFVFTVPQLHVDRDPSVSYA